MSQEEGHQQRSETLGKLIGSENAVEASQASATDAVEPGRTTATVSEISSKSVVSGGPVHLKYQSDSIISDAPYHQVEVKEYSRGRSKVTFRDLEQEFLPRQDYRWTCISRRRFGGYRCRNLLLKSCKELAAHEIMRLRPDVSKTVPSEMELANLAGLLLCRRYHQQNAAEIAKAWKKELSNSSPLSVSTMDKDTRPISTRDGFAQYVEQLPKSIISVIARYMRKPPSPLDKDDGFIYMFTRPGTPSMIKTVSMTDVQNLILQYTTRCHFKPAHLSQHFVQYRYRAERLIYTSLMEQRRRELNCNAGKGCNMDHDEWFEMDHELALSTVKRWAAWLNLNPYTSDQLDIFWKINLFKAEQLPSLDAFHQWVEHMTQSCIQRGEIAWRGRTDGHFWDGNETVDDEVLPSLPISPLDDEALPSSPISPVSSILSSLPSLTSVTTLSSTVSEESLASIVKEFGAWLLGDESIQTLRAVAIEKIGPERFERDFCRLLHIYSKDLEPEARTPSETQAVRFVRSTARHIANSVRSQVEPAKKHVSEVLEILSTPEPGRKEMLEQFFQVSTQSPDIGILDANLATSKGLAMSAIMKNKSPDDSELSDSEQDEDGLDAIHPDDIELDDEFDESDKLSLPSLGLVKEFMITSEAFDKLRENLRDLVFPPGQHTLEELVGTATEKTTDHSSAGKSATFLKPDHFDVEVNIVDPASDMANKTTSLTSISEKSNVAKLDSSVSAQESSTVDSISKVSIGGSAPISDPHRVDGGANPTPESCGGVMVNRAPSWKHKEPTGFSAWSRWAKGRWNKILRPNVKEGYRRIEWTCECGEDLFGDFNNSNPQAVDELAAALHASNSTESSPSRIPSSNPERLGDGSQSAKIPYQSTPNRNDPPPTIFQGGQQPPTRSPASAATIPDPQYLALCVNTEGFLKTLGEIEVSSAASDGEVFERFKASYLKLRGFRARFTFLIHPVDIRFVKFKLWDLRHGYVTILGTGNECCIPPADAPEYRYCPIPFDDLPPIGADVFLHYFWGGHADELHGQRLWVDRFPKRLKRRVIDDPCPVNGWGIYVIEGPNKTTVFGITMGTVFASILLSVLWSALRHDIQGAMALGSMVIALPPVIMTAFLYKLTA